jgi:hypothetical protein
MVHTSTTSAVILKATKVIGACCVGLKALVHHFPLLSSQMTNQHPITPPPELLDQWCMENNWRDIAIQAAQWGADQELEACCEWLECNYNYPQVNHPLRAARRPKPPSLKEQALESLQFVDEKLDLPLHNHCNAIHTIRRALEALDD